MAEHPEFEAYLSTVKYDRGLSILNNTQEDWFAQIVTALIRLSYSADAEIAIMRQKETKPDVWDDWNQYAEDAKVYARAFVYGVQQQSVTG